MPVLKGAFVRLDAGLLGFLPNVIVFQFNPETLSRSPGLAQTPAAADGSGPRDTLEQPSEPSEQISFTLRLDATDQLVDGDAGAVTAGVLPALSALELLMHPQASPADDLRAALGGLIQGGQPFPLPPQRLPTVLFFWGGYRILPVTVSALSVTETHFDQLLNPLRAEVGVTLQVMTPSQLDSSSSLARGAYEYTQRTRETMAAVNLAQPTDSVIKTIAAL